MIPERPLFVFLLLLIVGSGFSQSLNVEVYEIESHQALSGVRVTLHETEESQITGDSGRVQFEALPQGHYHLHLEKTGYEAQQHELYYPEESALKVFLKPSFIELSEVVVEESFTRKGNRKTSLDIQSVNPDFTEQAEANSVGESLEKLPGVSALNTGVGIAKPVIRGFMGNRVAVLDQGIKQQGQQWGMDHGLEIDPFQAQRMELVKGPQALQYGSDAVGGVLKILPEPLPVPGISGNATSLYKSNNHTLGTSAEVRYRHKQHFWAGRVSYQRYSDYQVPATEFNYNGFNLPITDNTLKNTAGQLASARLQYGLQKSTYSARYMVSHYSQKVGLYPGATGIPRAYDVGQIGSSQDIDLPFQQVQHTKLYSKQNIKIGGHWLRIDAGYQYNDRAEQSLPHNHGFEELDSSNTLALGLKLHTATLNADYSWHNSWAEFTVGVNQQYQRNFRSGFEYLIPDFSTYNSGLFALAEGQWKENWFWNAGIRADYGLIRSPQSTTRWWNDVDSTVVRSPEIDRQLINYSWAGGLAFNPNETWNFKLNLARSFRLPAVAELASNGVHHGTFRHEVGQPVLDSERGWQLDGGATYQNQQLYFKLTPFVNYFQNFIYLKPAGRFSLLPDAGQLYIYNQAEVFQTGAELFVDWHIWESLHWSNASEYIFSENLETGLPLPFTPPFSNLMSLKWQEKEEGYHWFIGADWRYTAEQNRVDRNEDPTPGYQLFHLKGGYGFLLWNLRWQTSISVQNLFNTAYLRHLSRYRILNLPEQGRNLIFALDVSF